MWIISSAIWLDHMTCNASGPVPPLRLSLCRDLGQILHSQLLTAEHRAPAYSLALYCIVSNAVVALQQILSWFILFPYVPPRLNSKHHLPFHHGRLTLPAWLSGSDPLPIDFVLDKRLWISWFPQLRFCGCCRNLEITIIGFAKKVMPSLPLAPRRLHRQHLRLRSVSITLTKSLARRLEVQRASKFRWAADTTINYSSLQTWLKIQV